MAIGECGVEPEPRSVRNGNMKRKGTLEMGRGFKTQKAYAETRQDPEQK